MNPEEMIELLRTKAEAVEAFGQAEGIMELLRDAANWIEEEFCTYVPILGGEA